MKTIIGALLAFVMLGGAAAEKPNFSGEWKMNAARSNFGGLPAPTSMVRKITHAEPSLTIAEEQQSDLGVQNTTRKYTTDGRPSSFEANGAEVKGSAVWEGDDIVVTSSVDGIGLKFVDRMTVSDGGRTLTSAVHISSAQGEIDITVVFDKQ